MNKINKVLCKDCTYLKVGEDYYDTPECHHPDKGIWIPDAINGPYLDFSKSHCRDINLRNDCKLFKPKTIWQKHKNTIYGWSFVLMTVIIVTWLCI